MQACESLILDVIVGDASVCVIDINVIHSDLTPLASGQKGGQELVEQIRQIRREEGNASLAKLMEADVNQDDHCAFHASTSDDDNCTVSSSPLLPLVTGAGRAAAESLGAELYSVGHSCGECVELHTPCRQCVSTVHTHAIEMLRQWCIHMR